LAEYLWRTTHSTRGRKRQAPDQIHHFSSHFDTTNRHPESHAIRLAGCSESEFSVELRELEDAFYNFAFNGDSLPEKGARPFVFVNACGTSLIDPCGITSLPDLFLGRLRSRGYVGTETAISDAVAEEFACDFYLRLFRGATAGQALHDARRALALKHRNPLGLFYTAYIPPNLKLQIPTNHYAQEKPPSN
jgi:hypothetical protein